MYANLAVNIGRKPLTVSAAGHAQYEEEVAAYAVDIDGTTAIVKLDDPDDDSSYYAPIGERTVDLTTHAIAIAANF